MTRGVQRTAEGSAGPQHGPCAVKHGDAGDGGCGKHLSRGDLRELVMVRQHETNDKIPFGVSFSADDATPKHRQSTQQKMFSHTLLLSALHSYS